MVPLSPSPRKNGSIKGEKDAQKDTNLSSFTVLLRTSYSIETHSKVKGEGEMNPEHSLWARPSGNAWPYFHICSSHQPSALVISAQLQGRNLGWSPNPPHFTTWIIQHNLLVSRGEAKLEVKDPTN